MNWLYKNQIIEQDSLPSDSVGFVYLITHNPTGRYYIGKKLLSSTRKTKIGKRELQAIKDEKKANGVGGRLPSKKIVKKESDWMTYFSSNDEIKSMIKEGKADEFTREILRWCPTKKSLSYWEVWYQFKHDVLSDEKSFNNNIMGSYYRKDVI
jgi:hypothetical protein